VLTIRNTNVETIDRNYVNVGGHQITCSWDDELRAVRLAGHANWSDQEIADLAYHAETRMQETYTRAYEIVIYEGFNMDTVHVLESIRAADDAAANAYAEANYNDHEWFVLNDKGENING